MKCYFCKNENIKKECENLNFYLCENCGLYARYPMPTEDELNKIYAQCYSDSNIVNDVTNQSSPNEIYQLYAQYIQTLFTKKSQINLLDYGSSTGGFLDILERELGLNHNSFDGVEYSKEARIIANSKRLRAYENIPKKKYNIITVIEVIEHLKEPWIDLKNLYDSLEINGKIIITTPNRKGLNALINGCSWREQNKDFHLIMFDVNMIIEFLENIGFTNIKAVKYFPVPKQGVFSLIKHRVLQLLNLHGGIFIVAEK